MLKLKSDLQKITERMLNKVENNSKSGLKINHIISVVLVLIILSSNIQLFGLTKQEDKQENSNNNMQEETQAADTYNRARTITSRSSVDRTKKEENELNYIQIDEITISKSMDLTKRTGISKEDFKELMKNLKVDTSGFFYKNSDIIYDLCEKYELNEVFFCGLIAAESGWNIQSNHRKTHNYISMMSKGRLIKYTSEEEGLEAAAKLLHTKYLTPGGSYYRGKTLASIQKIFCPNSSTWVGLVYGCMKQVIK